MNGFRVRRALLSALVLVLLALGAVAVAGAGGKGPAVRNGGTLTIGLAEDPDALDPTLARTFVGRMVFLHMCEKLYDLNSKTEIVPQLAKSLPVFSGADKKTVTIKLRTGIKFNDGTQFNAQAVKISLDRHRTLPRSTRASELSPVDSVDAVGSDTVVLHLNSRFSPITAQLADRAGMIMSPKQLDALGDKFATNPVCVGPFTFKDRVAGDHITLTKSQDYYDKAKVHLDSIVFRIITDGSARSANLRSHDIDVEDRIPSTELGAIQADKSLSVIKSQSIGYQGLTINIGNKNGIFKPYENVGTPLARSSSLRQAFELAIDRNTLNKVVFNGTVDPDCFPLAPASPWYVTVKKLPCSPKANLALAQKLVKGSGVATPIPVRMMIGTDPVAARFGQVIQSMEKAAGFDVTLDPTEFVTSLRRADAGQFDVFAIGWSGRVDPDGNTYLFLHTGGTQNDSGFSDPRVDRALDNARKAATQKAREVTYAAAFQKVRRQRPIIYLYHAVTRHGVSKKVTGVGVYGDGLLRAQYAGFAK